MTLEKKLNKIYVSLIAIMFIAIAISSVFAVRTITNTGDNIDTFIRNSKGNYWTATLANAQLAIYDLNGTGGHVWLPPGNFSVTTKPLSIPSHVWLQGSGESTIISLGPDVNLTIIHSQGYVAPSGYSTGQHNIKISDLTIYGTQYSNPRPFDAGGGLFKARHAIKFAEVNDSTIENVIIDDSYYGCLFNTCNRINVINCKTIDLGKNYSGYSTATNEVIPYAFWFKGGYNCTVSHCLINNSYCGGIALESGAIGGVATLASNNCLIDSCIINGAQIGYYMENGFNCNFNDCIARNITKLDAYRASNQRKAYGFLIGASTYGNTILGCKVLQCGNPTGLNGSGIYIAAANNTIDSCYLNTIYGNGSYISAADCIITNTIIKDARYYGIFYTSSASANIQRKIVTNNKIINPTKTGIYISPGNYGNRQKNGLIEGNLIYSSATTASTYGIYNKDWNMTVTGNNIQGFYNGIYSYGGSYCIYANNHISGCGNIGIHAFRISANDKSGQNNTISNNVIVGCTDDGIQIDGVNNTVISNNIISYCVDGIQLGVSGLCRNNTLMGNIITICTKGIYETAYGDYSKIIGNNCISCATPIDITGANTSWFVSASRGYGFNTGAIS